MRTKNSMKNMYIAIVSQIVMLLLAFISRKIFLDSLGTEYLGVNGLLTNILSMLSLVEGGIGASIVYNLYKPLADDDKPKIISLVQLYKKLYFILAVIVLVLSLSLYPFLNKFIKDFESLPYIFIVYLIFVSKNVISYLNAHKWSLINADQKAYVLARYNLVFNVSTTISKIIILLLTNSYISYLLVEILIFIVQNLWNGKIVNERYPYIKTKEKFKVTKEIKENLIINFKALILHKIGGYIVFGTDNILISIFVNIKTVGLYSNYTMIIAQLSSLVGPILGSIGDSVGNLIATESKEKKYEIYKTVYLINFWIYSVCTIFLYNLLEIFICWWLGDGLLLDRLTLIVVLINFYLFGLRTSILTFKNKAGIFTNDKYIPLLESVINLGASVILVKYIGLAGIFLGTVISTIALPLWVQAKLVYNNIFGKSVFEYLKRYVIYAVLTIVVGIITSLICNSIIIFTGFTQLVVRGIICITIPNIIYMFIFYRTNEFRHIWNILSKHIISIKNIASKKINNIYFNK